MANNRAWILVSVLLVLLAVDPSRAMMGGMHDSMQSGGYVSEGDSGQKRKAKATTRPKKQKKSSSTASKQSVPRKDSTTEKSPTNETATGTTKESQIGTPLDSVENNSKHAASGKSRNPGLYWKDDMKMLLVHGGKIVLPERIPHAKSGSTEVGSFYMDETQVTNYQYVAFLNKVLPNLSLENGVVRKDGEIWFLLGEVESGYEPILYKDGRFSISAVHHAACAVLRVTAYGASAYADFYGKRLPTILEWFYAASTGHNKPVSLPIPSPVVLYPENDYGIRGLDSNIGEWALSASHDSSGGEEKVNRDYFVMGGVFDEGENSKNSRAGVKRYPWEAFGQAGFRCVVDVPAEKP